MNLIQQFIGGGVASWAKSLRQSDPTWQHYLLFERYCCRASGAPLQQFAEAEYARRKPSSAPATTLLHLNAALRAFNRGPRWVNRDGLAGLG